MPVIAVFFGIVIRMWHDDHPPPHIHVHYQGFEALVDIRTGEVTLGRLPRRAATLVKDWCLRHQMGCVTGAWRSGLSHWNEFRGPTKMIKILEARCIGECQLELLFSNGQRGIFNARHMLERDGSLLVALRDPAYFSRVFLDAGTLCWPNGLELSPARVYEQAQIIEVV